MSNRLSQRLATIPLGTLFVGIDLSLDSLVVMVLDANGQRLDRFRTSNDVTGYAYLRERLQRIVTKHHAATTTGNRWATTWNNTQSLSVSSMPSRSNATAKAISWIAPKTLGATPSPSPILRLRSGRALLRTGKFTETHLPQGVYAELQTGYTAYLRLHRDRGRQVTLLRNTVRQLFPEFEQVFKDVSGFTATAVIAAGLNPRLISTQSPSEFVANVRANFQGERLALRQVQALYAWAPYSQGLPEATTALALMAQHQAETIRLLDAQAQQVHQPLLNLFHTLPEAPYLLSIQGLQDTNGLALVACSGDLTQYASGAALIKLAGTAPTPNTSGRKRYSLTPFSHQGRSDLRTVLYFITLRLITQNDALYYHYQRLTTRTPRPSPKMQALGACMNKLLWYAWHVVKHCEMYDPDRWRLLA